MEQVLWSEMKQGREHRVPGMGQDGVGVAF